jgi:serine/threonine protein kinase/Tol biopolymer transport system component
LALTPGTRFGPYEVTALIGEGGMGQVYRGLDTRLNRTVAIKVLHAHFADAEMKQRFEREAQTIAGLNHPNICTLHDVGREAEVDFLVMEYIEGETLASRLARGPLPLAEAIIVASQIGDALDKAHRLGVIHRDLKPANVMLTTVASARSGSVHVKLLDFGLAKVRTSEPTRPMSVSVMPTNAKDLTMVGAVLGTLQYMAPEQLEGKDADARTDIFAFGATLYEMLTGRKAFQAKSHVSLMASILEHDPPSMSTLLQALPPALDEILGGCLAKDPEERWQSIRDVVHQLKRVTQTASAAGPRPNSGAVRSERFVWIGAIVLVAAISAWLGLRARTPPEAPKALVRFDMPPPESTTWSADAPRMALSPDGESLVYAAVGVADRKEQFWIRRLDAPDAKPIAGTEATATAAGPQSPFWSPNGRVLGFVSQKSVSGNDSIVRTVDLSNGFVQTLCELPSNNAGGSLNADGVAIVASQGSKGVLRVPASGGVPSPVTVLDETQHEVAHIFPQFLPDGRHFLYHARTTNRGEWAVYVASLDTKARTKLVRSDYAQFAAPDRLLYVRGDGLMAQRIDLDTLTLAGEPVLVTRSVANVPNNGRVAFSVSNTGVLAYKTLGDATTGVRRLQWFDRQGKPGPSLAQPITAFTLRLSPDGTRVAIAESPPNSDLWTYDLARGIKTRLTSDPAPDTDPAWTSDGSRLFFSSNRTSTGGAVFEMPSNASTVEHVFIKPEATDVLIPVDASLDGRLLVFGRFRGGRSDLWWTALGREAKPVPYLSGSFDLVQAALSPDGRWLAYVSTEAGGFQVMVQPFPDPTGGKLQISTDGGNFPRWRRDGRELYYADPRGRLIAVPLSVDRGGTLQAGAGTPLFQLSFFYVQQPRRSSFPYDASADGQRFLVSVPERETNEVRPITVTLNWTAPLK